MANKDSLRPVGTEYWHETPFPHAGSDGRQYRFLYRVKSHDKVLRFFEDVVGEWAETVEVIKSEYRNMISISKCDECGGIKYGFGEWIPDKG